MKSQLGRYYAGLLRWEGVRPRRLTKAWPLRLVRQVEVDFRKAVMSHLHNKSCPIRPGTTNQSVGNQVEQFAISLLKPALRRFRIENCRGSGYPDRMLVRVNDGYKTALEVKATGHWDAKNMQRRVLTASSRKLITRFNPPVCHLLCTIVHDPIDRRLVRIRTVRLDFLEPTTVVDVRLEASVSHKSLDEAPHHCCVIPGERPFIRNREGAGTRLHRSVRPGAA
jgi:hypothetical protein